MFAITYQEPKNLVELQLGVWNFCGDFNARNKKNEVIFTYWYFFFSHFLDIFDSIYHSVAFLQTDNSLLKAERWSAGRFARSRT